MVQFLSSPAVLASIPEGRGLKQSARDAGVRQKVGYRWLKERYLQLRRGGAGPAEAIVHMGSWSSRMEAWELEVDRSTGHHLWVQEPVEDVFWDAFKAGRPQRRGPGWLHLLVLLFIYIAMKFTIIGPVSLVLLLRAASVGTSSSARTTE